jgi:hypothetical protein
MPIERNRAVDLAVVDQQLRRRAAVRGSLDRRLDRIAVELAAVDRDQLRSDRQAGES